MQRTNSIHNSRKNDKIFYANQNLNIYMHAKSCSSTQAIIEIAVKDPRDAFLLMLNERVGELETSMHQLTAKLDILIDRFTTITTKTVNIMLGLPYNSSPEQLFHKENDAQLAQIVFETINPLFEIEEMYIYHPGTRCTDANIYLVFKKEYVFHCVEKAIDYNKFKDRRGCHVSFTANITMNHIKSALEMHSPNVSQFTYD